MSSRKEQQLVRFSFDPVDFRQLQEMLDRRTHFRLIQRSMNEAGKLMNRDVKKAMRDRYTYKGAPTKADIKPVPAKGGMLAYTVYAQFRRLSSTRFKGVRKTSRRNENLIIEIVKGRIATVPNAYVKDGYAFKRHKSIKQKKGFGVPLKGMSFYSMYRSIASKTGGNVAQPSFERHMNRVFVERLEKLLQTYGAKN